MSKNKSVAAEKMEVATQTNVVVGDIMERSAKEERYAAYRDSITKMISDPDVQLKVKFLRKLNKLVTKKFNAKLSKLERKAEKMAIKNAKKASSH